ncbi:hypothetical protein CRN15_07135 [Raoultella planticola]|nr:hypothetical protein CRT62_00520 [Raoultella planticola]ATM14649.1 hypothetical protein CRN15_07135 [Raoultella planticola]PHH25409.1 hypothetical protein CRX55_15820 [Raoultella planticola]PIM84234.1 hypothetical protein CT151_12005 [Raoultella planticola]
MLPVNYFVTSSIVFFYISKALFSRSLWITAAFSAVRFNVRAINRSHIGHVVINFHHLPELLITGCYEVLRHLCCPLAASINFSAENSVLKFF